MASSAGALRQIDCSQLMPFDQVVLSCEHGGAVVPLEFARLFRSRAAQHALRNHRGSDLGSLVVARALARRFGFPLLVCPVTRLLVDVNRSVGHRRLFSEFVAPLSPVERARVLAQVYTPHRDRVEASIARAIKAGHQVLHLSIHTFVPRLQGEVRRADIGLLYDPMRPRERELCGRWKQLIAQREPRLRLRCNYPYRGAADGLTTLLRTRFRAADYAGIELEFNQRLVGARGPARASCVRALGDTLDVLLRLGRA